MIAYSAALDVPREVALHLAALLRGERVVRGTRRSRRSLGCFKQAVLALRWFLDGTGSSNSPATAPYPSPRPIAYPHEAVDLLAAQAPDIHTAIERVKAAGTHPRNGVSGGTPLQWGAAQQRHDTEARMPGPRWVQPQSRTRWTALGQQEREELFEAARRGEPHPDPEIALSAVHWSWAVLGQPGARRAYPWWDLFLHAAPASMFENVYNGAKQHDMRVSVRREARRVEAANLDHLERLGVETGEELR
jgi:hypothetical protein